jgi:transposase
MDKREAELLYDTGKEPTVTKLLEQDALIRLLQQRLDAANTNSTNSSKPPSSDAPGVKHRKKTPSNRKPGGQEGHDGKNRPLLPVEQMDDVHDYYPDVCEKCHKPLTP